MESTQEPDGSNLILMVSPTTGRLLLVLPSNVVGFAGTASVASFANPLGDQSAEIRRLLGGSDRSPIPENYGSQAILEWEDTLKGPGPDDEPPPVQ